MVKSSVITLPDGTKIEVSPDLSPDQITAMITALTMSNLSSPQSSISETDDAGELIVQERSLDEIWEASKRERVALFIRTFMAESFWFSAKDLMDLQLQEFNSIVLGETSQIGTYLQRLYENGYLDKKKTPNGRSVSYRMSSKLSAEYPFINIEQMKQLLQVANQ